MARLSYDIPVSIENQFNKLVNDIHKTALKMVEAAIPPVVDALRAAVEEHRDTGAMIESVGVLEKDGIVSTADGAEGKVGFNGYDAKGVANDLKASAIEYGTSRQKAKPFLSKVKRETQKEVEAAMQSVLDKEVGTS